MESSWARSAIFPTGKFLIEGVGHINSQEQWTGHTCSTNCNVQPIRNVAMQLRPEFVNLKIMMQQKRSLVQKKDPSDLSELSV